MQPLVFLSDEQLGDVDIAMIVKHHADAYFLPLSAQNIGPVAGTGHESSLGFFHGGVVSNVFTYAIVGITKMGEHLGRTPISGGFVGKIAVVLHVLGFDAGNAAESRVQGEGRQAVTDSVLIE